ncbi:glycerol kinase GlpK [Gammaproteobacteria bacterium]|nr:glycerol kinase GlpK [Gammaproteobacteria bacterium]
MNKKIMAIDQGTTSSRAVIFDQDGSFIDYEQKEFKQFFPNDGWVEHDPDEIWESVLSVSETLIKRLDLKPSDIASIGITNQRETTLVWNKKTGRPVYPAIVWQDRRTSELCNNFKTPDLEKMIQAKTGLLIDPYFSATKLAWILDNVDGAREGANNGDLLFGTVDSFLVWKLTGGKEHKTDATNASRTMLFNIAENSWDVELLNLFKIPESMLPEVCDNVHDYGVTNLFGGSIAIGGAAGDQQAALIGQCCFEEGDVKSTYGTGCFVILNTGKDFLKSKNKLLSTIAYRIDGEITYGMEGSIFVAGSAIQWLRDGLNFFESASDTETLIQQAHEDSKVVVVPALTGLGAPHWDPEARGAIYGLTRDSGVAEITKATLESITYQTKDLLEAMRQDGAEIKELKIDGGMVANSWFSQELANVLSIKTYRPEVIETTAVGAAFLAGINAGIYSDFDSLKDVWKVNREFIPSSTYQEEGNQKYLRWQEAVRKTLA